VTSWVWRPGIKRGYCEVECQNGPGTYVAYLDLVECDIRLYHVQDGSRQECFYVTGSLFNSIQENATQALIDRGYLPL